MFTNCLCVLLHASALAAPPAAGRYAVLVDPGPGDAFLPAATALADFHRASLCRFDTANLDGAFAELKKVRPDFVAFVLPPEKIDVDLAHAILERSARLGDGPFSAFEYGFITGRDGPAAVRFVDRIKQAWRRNYGRTATMFGSWEGVLAPPAQPLTAFKALKAEAEARFVRTRDGEAARRKAAREALGSCKGKDLLLFFSHGEPDEMAGCFRAKDLRDWGVDLAPAVLVNCACYNGAPGRWYAPGKGGVEDRGLVARDDSVCLAVLDAGVAGYFAGVDPWHGPLAMQVSGYIFDDGLRLGAAAKMMHDRLAIDFLPGRIHFEPTLKEPDRFAGEGTSNRRHNGAGLVLYGDPAFAPFAKSASRLGFAELKTGDGGKCELRLGTRPLVDGAPAVDFMIPQNRLFDYYSVKTANFMKELALEVYRVVPLPAGTDRAPTLRVKSARSGSKEVPTGRVQAVVEVAPAGNRLHVRVPLAVRGAEPTWSLAIARDGITIELEGETAH